MGKDDNFYFPEAGENLPASANGEVSLPVALIDFTAKPQDKGVLLEWQGLTGWDVSVAGRAKI